MYFSGREGQYRDSSTADSLILGRVSVCDLSFGGSGVLIPVPIVPDVVLWLSLSVRQHTGLVAVCWE